MPVIGEAAGVAREARDVTVVVAPGYSGVVHRVSPASADVVISATVVSQPVLDQNFNVVGSVTVTLGAVSHSETGVFRGELTGGGTLEIEMISTLPEATALEDVFRVTLIGADAGAYVPRGEEISVRVSVLSAAPGRVDLVLDSSEGGALGTEALYDFAGAAPVYAGAEFSRESGSAELVVTPEGEVRAAAGTVLEGGFRYEIEARATGSGVNPFLGSAGFSARADVYLSEGDVDAALPVGAPLVFAARGYAGEVYVLTLAAGAGLEASYPFAGTPPEGFGFDETSGAVALTLALASEGAGGDFVVRLTRAGSPIYSDAVVSLSVSALASPVQGGLDCDIGG